MKRLEVTTRVGGLVERVVNGEGRYLPRVREVWIFGSYARGALEVGDVDLAVEFDQTKEEAGCWFATRMAGGFDHLGALRRDFAGNQRVLSSISTNSTTCAASMRPSSGSDGDPRA